MKLHPMRNAHVGRSVLRGRIMSQIFSSSNGKRVLRECREALDLPVNSDEVSRQYVLATQPLNHHHISRGGWRLPPRPKRGPQTGPQASAPDATLFANPH